MGAFVGHCNDNQLRGLSTHHFVPALSATVSSVQEAGEQLAEILVAKIQGEIHDTALRRILQVELVVHDSVAAHVT